jgi:hypothetical protein
VLEFSHSRASPCEPPAAAPKSLQCAARSRAREKRTLAAFLPSRAAASVLAAAGRARLRAKAANRCACSPWAQGRLGPTSQTRPKRPGEVYGCLRVLPEQLAGGEHEWKLELGAAAAMAAVRLGVARWGARRCFYRRLEASVGDGG